LASEMNARTPEDSFFIGSSAGEEKISCEGEGHNATKRGGEVWGRTKRA